MKKIIYSILGLMAFIITSCSKDSNNNPQIIEEQGYFPKTISLEYNSGERFVNSISYNDEGQISLIDFERNSPDGSTRLTSDFKYNSEGQLIKVLTENITDAAHYDISFGYNTTDGSISEIALISGDAEKSLSIFYIGGEANGYIVDGELGNLPTAWDFDADNNLNEMSIAGNNFSPQYFDTGKGIFYDVNTQPALVIWHGLLFYLSNYEFCYFSKVDIEKIKTNEFPYLFENKVRNSDGFLISFQIQYAGIQIIDYTIEYEKRNISM